MAVSANVAEHMAPWELAAFLDQSGEPLGPGEGALTHGPGNRETSVAGAQWPKWGRRSLSQGDGGNTDDAGPFKAIAWTLAFFSK